MFAAALSVTCFGTAFASGVQSVAAAVTFQDPDGTVNDQFGDAVALSANGSEALVAAGGATVDGVVAAGKAYLYTQSSGTWSSTPVATFLDPTLQPVDHFGDMVQLSADGTVAVITSGSPAGNDEFVYIYEQNNGVWSTTPVIQLTDPNPSERDTFGDSFGCVSLSADGNTLLVGANAADVNGVMAVGTAYVYTRTNGVWAATPVATLNDPGNVKGDFFGCGALNANGTVAIIGTLHQSSLGRVFIFTQTNGVWNTAPLTTFTAGQASELDVAQVALSGSGDLALLGVGNANGNAGAAYFYAAANGSWPVAPTVTLSDPVPAPGNVYFGSQAVALSGDGTVALIDGNTTDAGTAWGTVYVYTGTAAVWANTPAAMLADPQPLPRQGSACCDFGYSIALSQNGSTVIVGSPDPPMPAVGLIGGAGWAYIYDEPKAGWANPTSAPPPTTTAPPASGAGGGGGGALGLFSLLGLAGLALLAKRNVRHSDPREC